MPIAIKQIPQITEKDKKDFWKNVDASNVESCWLWIPPPDNKRYGRMKVQGQRHQAHRISFTIAFGAIPKGINVLHKCDNPRCVNPNHLFLGTHGDNMRDMLLKNRGNKARGENNGAVKLTVGKVREARHLYKSGANTYMELSKKYGVAFNCIRNAIIGVTWAHVSLASAPEQQLV